MELALDNSRRLERRSYVFEYDGLQFKLVQDNPREHADHLLTILPSGSASDQQRAFAAASNFAAALSWANRAATAVWVVGGRGWHASWGIRRAQPRFFTFPRIPFSGLTVGCSLNVLPTIETEEQRLALTLFREARASNNEYLSFLFFWQVLAIAGSPEGVANKLCRKHRSKLRFIERDLTSLPLRGRTIGQYLADDCRHAIAHVSLRKGGGTKQLDFDSMADRMRMHQSVIVVQELARVYMTERLTLTRTSALLRIGKSTIPVYSDLDEIRVRGVAYSHAYPRQRKFGEFASPSGGRGRKLAPPRAGRKP